MGSSPIVVPTVAAKVLLGWMERDQAVNFLQTDCVFPVPLIEEEAHELWRVRNERVQALPERPANAPTELPLDAREQAEADAFMRAMGQAPNVKRVIKIDPHGLVAYQPVVVLDQVGKYQPHAVSAADYACKSLSTLANRANLQIQAGFNMANVAVPHGEFIFAFNGQAGQFQIQELARHISVTEFQSRMLLWSGYHRSYARIASAKPDGKDRSLLVALTTDGDSFVSPQSPNQGLRAMVCGLRPSLLGDFFDDTLFMAVNLKRKRFVLQIRAICVPVDDV
jgi:hypothetical protein